MMSDYCMMAHKHCALITLSAEGCEVDDALSHSHQKNI